MYDNDDLIYRLNDYDEIIFVNEKWDEFAVANDSQEATAQHVLNRPIWDFIVDATVQTLYRDIFHRVRTDSPVSFTYRCDSPACRRLMETDIFLTQEHAIEIRARALITADRPVQRLLEPHTPRSSDALLQLCSWCNKIHIDNDWVEAEEAVGRLRLFEQSQLPKITHCICEPCHDKMRKTLSATPPPNQISSH
jgi:hypothetical protein